MNATNIYTNDFLDILFEGRNKDYGAYDLRRSQDKRLRNAIIGTATLALVVIGGYVVNNNLKAADMHTRITVPDDHIVIPPITLVVGEKKPVTAPLPASSSITFTTPEITAQNVIEDIMPPVGNIGNKTVSVIITDGADIKGEDAPLFAITENRNIIEPSKGADDSTIHCYWNCFLGTMPAFPGGEAALTKFLQQNIRYPARAVETGIEGRINVQFIIDREGNITGIKTTGNPTGAGLEEEAMRVVRLMPKWTPGKQNGEAVNVQFNLPVGFHLQK